MMLAQMNKILMVDFGVRLKLTDLDNILVIIGVTVQMNVFLLHRFNLVRVSIVCVIGYVWGARGYIISLLHISDLFIKCMKWKHIKWHLLLFRIPMVQKIYNIFYFQINVFWSWEVIILDIHMPLKLKS